MKKIMRHFIRGAIRDAKWADKRIVTCSLTPKSKAREDSEHGFQKVRLVRQGSAVFDMVCNITRLASTRAR